MATEAREVDLTGEVCPMTFVKAKLHLDRLAVGDATTLILKAGDQIRNVPRSLRDEGHAIEAVQQDGDRYRLLVRKGE
ncbi:MAG: sulfurtransferase TusA family protein [Armatimonadetes bacterium]|nr:sulfurtransferase TusA family protein [Armatimonadota bacterium]